MSGDHAERGPASGSASRLRRSLERLFELPGALPLPGDHREIEQLVEAERHGEAATAIANLRFGRLAQQSRQATAQAICWMHAGRPERAVALLGAAKPTMTNAWVLACALVRVGRLDEAADHVTWVGDRRPLFGAERVAAQVLFRALGRPLPHWLIDPARGTSQDRPSRRPIPPPYLASFFYPMRPEVPTGFADAAEAIQEGRYGDAAQHLIARGVSGSRVGREVAMAAAECWLLADEPEAAAAWLQHRLSLEGTWTLACALVHQDRLEEALVPLAGLARRRLLHEDRRQAAAALVAHLGLEALPAGLEELEGHPFLDLPRAQEAGYRRFIDKVVREIQRHGDADSAERVVHRVLDQCESIPENEARRVLVPTYEAAVRACCARPLAERGLHLMLSRPELLGSRESEYSRALLFATASERLDELHEQLQLTADRTASRDVRFACLLASAKLKLVQADRQGATAAAEQARDVAVSSEDEGRAGRLVRAARWLPVAEGPRLSQWQLRQLHHLLPLAVAERLEDRDSRFLVLLEQCGRVSPAARPSVEAAGRCLRMAAAYADAPTGLPRLRRALGLWALHVGSALLEADRASGGEAVAFTGAAWRLLGPDPPPEVVAAHGRSVGIALAGLAEQIQVRARLDSVARAMPANEATETLIEAALDAWQERRRTRASGGGPRSLDRLLDPVSPRCSPPRAVDVITGIGRLEDLPPLARQAVEECLVDRLALLPEAAPYRGGRWFESNTAHRLYQQGREEQDARNAHKAFEQAWKAEPNNRITIQGLIFGLGRRLSEKSGRSHVLDHMARLLDQMAERELEAALACTTLARFARDDRERRDHQERAAAALERRVRRAPWARARNAEIALHLELGNLPAAGHAAWEESCLYLPGTEPSNRYALLAAALWERARDAEPRLEGLIRDARRRARSSRLTNRQAVQYTAVTTGRLVALTDLVLDDDVLEDLWRACRGDEGDLCRFLEKQGTRRVGPRPHYLRFLVRKLQTMDPAAAARIRNCYIARDCAPEPPNIRWLRLAMAELLTRDPLHEVAAPRDQLGECHMRELMFTLRQSSRGDEVAYAAFATAVEDALAALFELREAAPVSGPEQYGERLARASDALQVVRRAAMRFGVPVVSDLARQLFSYLALALEPPTVEVYLREKERRLVASRIGARLGAWWAGLAEVTGPLDFFHYHASYRHPQSMPLDQWWAQHRVHGRPVRDAVRELLQRLQAHADQLSAIEAAYRTYQRRRDPNDDAFGMRGEFDACCAVLSAALESGAGPSETRAVAGALERLGGSLRRIDMARLVDLRDVLYDSAVAPGRYLLPRAPELLEHWRRNVGGGPSLQVICEMRDDSGREVLCLLCLDAESKPAPESTPLRGLAPFADLVEALGGQLHLWIARPGERSACRREHDNGIACAAEDYVPRIEERLRQLSTTRWHSMRQRVEPWLGVLADGLHATGRATLAFAMLPRLHGEER